MQYYEKLVSLTYDNFRQITFLYLDHDSLGFCEVSLGEIVAGQSRGFSKQLFNKKGFLKVSIDFLRFDDLLALAFNMR